MVTDSQLTSNYTTTLALDSRPSSSSNETSHRDSEFGEAGEVIGVENVGLTSGQNEVGGCEGVLIPGTTAECEGAEVGAEAGGAYVFADVPASGTTSIASKTLVGSDVTSSDAQRVSTLNIIHQHSRFFYLAFLTPISRTFFSRTSSLQFLFYW